MNLSTQIPIPKGVSDTALDGLVLRGNYRRGGTSVGVGTAKVLAYQTHTTLKKVLHIAKYFPRHAEDNLEQRNPPSNGYIAWLLWGGDPGRRWANRVKAKWERENG